MASAAEIQALLRFLSQDAKVPLPTAMSKVKELHKAALTRSGLRWGTSVLTEADASPLIQSCGFVWIGR